MANEFLDIVNKENEVIGQEWKYKMHQEGILHRTVIAEVVDDNRVWTLMIQSADKQDTDQFVSAIGGHV